MGMALWSPHAQAPVYSSEKLGTRVQYFRITTAEGVSAAPLLTLTEPLVFMSRSEAPHPALGRTFSAVYEGYLLAPEVSGDVSFLMRTDAHVLFEINGRMCINEKYDAARQPYKCYEHLEAGGKYPYKLTYVTQLVNNSSSSSSSSSSASNAAKGANGATAADAATADDPVFDNAGSGIGIGSSVAGSSLYYLELKWVQSRCPVEDITCLEGELIPQANLLLE
jgi:hypothetical protein